MLKLTRECMTGCQKIELEKFDNFFFNKKIVYEKVI